MKKLILSLASTLIITTLYAQQKPMELIAEPGPAAKFQSVLEAEGKSASELYDLVNRWAKITFVHPDEAVYSRLENEMVRGEGSVQGGVNLGMSKGNMLYGWQIDVKEGKVRVTMYNMRVRTQAGTFAFEQYCVKKDGTLKTNMQAKPVRESFENQANEMLASLSSVILGNLKQDSDW